MSLKKLNPYLLVIIISFFVFSCKKKKTCPYGQKYAGKSCKCKVDSQCPKKEICIKGKCVKKAKYTKCPHIPCKDGKVCELGKCIGCKKDFQCGKNKFCEKGTCKTKGTQCNPDKDCPIGEKCNNGFCVKDHGPTPNCVGHECKTPCTPKPIFFGYKSSSLTQNQRNILKFNINCFKKAYKTGLKRIHIMGLCDPRGPTTFNDDLASLRIKTIIDELTLIDPSLISKIKITTEPLGEICAEGNNEETWKKDRRTEFVWFKKPGKVCP
jgi:hypothetical protein